MHACEDNLSAAARRAGARQGSNQADRSDQQRRTWSHFGSEHPAHENPSILADVLDQEKGLTPLASKMKNPWRTRGLTLHLEREKGFESAANPVFSRTYDTTEGDARGSTRPADASGRVATELQEGDDRGVPSPLPTPTSELFITAGAIVAEQAARDHAAWIKVQEILRRAVDQAAAVRGEVA
jgi:hypothetical protein